jgi:hypothetical protein
MISSFTRGMESVENATFEVNIPTKIYNLVAFMELI